MVLSIGDYKCQKSNGTGANAVGICALYDTGFMDVTSSSGQSMPPVVITVDYGDGSGEQMWTRDQPRNLWTHKYQLPGRYWVHISSKTNI